MSQGFFKKEDVQSKNVYTKGKTLSCFTCGLSKECSNPKLGAYGLFKKQILIITDFPTEDEDIYGKRWARSHFFKDILSSFNIDLYEDCMTIGSINCRPPGGRLPKAHELNCCREVKILPILKEHKPKLILVLGTEAVISVMGHRWKKGVETIEKWRGWQIPDMDFKTWVCPTYSPKYVERAKNGLLKVIFKQDLTKAFEVLSRPFLKFGKINIHYITDLSVLNDIQEGIIAFDYETTGIKPHAKKQKIVCASVAVDKNNVYVFPFPEEQEAREPFLNLLRNPNVKKVAQNMKFEDHWSAVKLKTKVRGWLWDTMIATHVLDNRSNITSLKFQVYVQLGIVDYDSEVSKYLKASEKGGNNLNQILEFIKTPDGLKAVLKYCAYDSIYEYRFAMIQRKQL